MEEEGCRPRESAKTLRKELAHVPGTAQKVGRRADQRGEWNCEAIIRTLAFIQTWEATGSLDKYHTMDSGLRIH